MRFLFLAVSVAFAAVAPAADIAPACSKALRRALGSKAAWTMERRFPGSVRTLVSTGAVECTVGEKIVWQTLHPFPFKVSMTTNSMIFADEDVVRVKPLSDMPHYNEIRRRADAFARGDIRAFDGLFKLKTRSSPGGVWHLELTPEISVMRRLFSTLTLTGRDTLTSVVLTSEDGGCSTISFKELPRDR